MLEKEIKAKNDSTYGKAPAEQTALQQEGAIPSKILEPESPQVLTESNYDIIYNELHNKFPQIINIEKPVLLAVGIRKEMAYATGITGIILNRWIAWYFRKSKYHKIHKEGAKRYNLLGEEAGIVTQEHCQKKAQQMEKYKKHKENVPSEESQATSNKL